MTKSQNTKNEQQKDLCITVEKQVWESTLHRSMVLQAENAQLKELLRECIPYFNALVEKRLKLEYIPQVYELLTKINEVLK